MIGNPIPAVHSMRPGTQHHRQPQPPRTTCASTPAHTRARHPPQQVECREPRKLPVGLVICSARTYTRDYQDVVAAWTEANVAIWGSVPERVSIAAGPEGALSPDGIEAYRAVWRRVLRAARES